MNINAIGETIFCRASVPACRGRQECLPYQATTASSMPEPGQSGGEAFAAGAMRDRIRVGNFKTALLQVVTEIED